MDSQHAAGTTIGMIIGVIKGALSIQFFGMLSWQLAGETALLAVIGGACGWGITEVLKYLKKKIKG